MIGQRRQKFLFDSQPTSAGIAHFFKMEVCGIFPTYILARQISFMFGVVCSFNILATELVLMCWWVRLTDLAVKLWVVTLEQKCKNLVFSTVDILFATNVQTNMDAVIPGLPMSPCLIVDRYYSFHVWSH